MNSTFASATCHPLSTSNGSCACHETATLDAARDCFTISCGRKDQLTALNITFKACTDKPPREKSTSYRHVNLAFYILAVVAIAGQWVVRFTIGRPQLLDDGNTFMILAVDTLLFAVCYKMSWTGLGWDMWNVPFEQITTTLLVS